MFATEDRSYGSCLGRRTILSNGIEVHTVCGDVWKDMAIRVVVDVGRYSDGDRPGATHLLEHLLLSHEIRGQRPWMDTVTTRGFHVGGQTRDTHTEYVLTGPSDQAGEGIRLVLGALFNPVWSEAHFAVEQGIVFQEEREKAAPWRVQGAWIRSTYPVLAPFFHDQDARRHTMDRIRELHTTHYGPAVTRVFYAGRGTHQDIVEAVASVAVPETTGRASPRITVPDLHPGRFHISEPHDEHTSVNFVWPTRPRWASSEVWSALAGWTYGLLYRRLRFDLGVLYKANLHDLNFFPQKVCSVRLLTRPEHLETVERVSEDLFEELRSVRIPSWLADAIAAEKNEEEDDEGGNRKPAAYRSPSSIVALMHGQEDGRRESASARKTEKPERDDRAPSDPDRIRDEARRLLDPAKQATAIIAP